MDEIRARALALHQADPTPASQLACDLADMMAAGFAARDDRIRGVYSAMRAACSAMGVEVQLPGAEPWPPLHLVGDTG